MRSFKEDLDRARGRKFFRLSRGQKISVNFLGGPIQDFRPAHPIPCVHYCPSPSYACRCSGRPGSAGMAMRA